MHPLKRPSASQNHSSRNTLASLFLPSHRDHSRSCVLIHPYTSRLSSSHRRSSRVPEQRQMSYTAVADFIPDHAHNQPPPLFFLTYKNKSYITSHLSYQLASVPCPQHFPEPKKHHLLASRMCEYPKSVRHLNRAAHSHMSASMHLSWLLD